MSTRTVTAPSDDRAPDVTTSSGMSGEVIGVGRTGDRVPSVLQSLGMGFRGVATLDDALVAMRTRPSVLLVASRDALAGEPLDGLRALRAGVAAPAGVMLIVDDAAQAMPFLAERLVDDFVMAAADPAALEARLLAALRKAETGQWLRVLAVAGETMATAKSLDGVFEGIARGLAPVLPLDQFAVAWEEGEDVLFERVVLEGDVVQNAPSGDSESRGVRNAVCERRRTPSVVRGGEG